MASEIFVWTYDLFLSFRGEDTRNSFTGHLYEALLQAGINTFMDTEELNRGMEISQELCDAIDKSRFFLVVFSKNYASSTWCLNELVRIMSCIESGKGQMVWPVFYDVDPSQVRKQTGIFGEAFTLHEERFKQNLEKVEKWREALTKAANLSGRDLDKGSEATLVKEIVREIWTELNRTLLTVAKNPVGIHYHIEKLESSLCLESNDVRMIGIYGLGGIGKTTIAKAVYNLIVDRFEGCSFLPNIKEKCNSSLHDGLVELQNLLLQDIFLDKRRLINFVDRGTCILKDRLRSKKVLIVLDDVDNVFHLEKLAGNANWFGLGSRVIITTRNMQLLSAHGIDWTYRVDGLNYADSLELFCWNAFNKPHPVENFDELSNIAVRYAAGLPLALIVVGASLCGYEEAAWESQLKKLEKIPNKDVHEILKLSFDGLEDHEKKIFLDIACFFRGFNSKEHIMSFFYSCGFYPESGIAVLVKKCLIFIEKGRFEMHDLIQSMGREIVRQESQHPGERSRLWYHEDIIQVLTENEGTKKVEGIFLRQRYRRKVSLYAEAFLKMKKLRLLILYNVEFIGTPQSYLSNELRWFECRGSSFSIIVPSTFHPKKLVVLDISRPINQLGVKLLQGFENLRHLSLDRCEMLTEICDISLMSNLVHLEIWNCDNLEGFSNGGLKSKSLEHLSLVCCPKLKKFPNILEEMGRLQRLQLIECGVTELPTSIEKLTCLQSLCLSFCKGLVYLPSSIYMLKSLAYISLSYCPSLEKFPEPWNSIAVSSDLEGNHNQDLDARGCVSLPKLDATNFFDIHKLYKNKNGDQFLWQDWREVFLSQGICNEKKIVLKVPGNKIPNSFQCPPSLPLSLHGKKHVVGIVLCLLLLHDDTSMGISIKIQINGLAVHKDFVFRSFSEDLWICYLPRNSSEVLDQLLKGNPSHFDVTFLEEGMGEKRTFLAEKIGVGLIFDEEAYISCGKKRKRIRIYGKKRKRI